MKHHEEYNDNNLNHVLYGPDYGQSYSENCTNLSWLIENSFEFEYNRLFENNGIFIEPCIVIY